MPDPTTTNIVLAVPTRGSDAGTWDTPVNGDMIILDACAGSVTTKTLSNVTVNLTVTESQVNIIRFTGTRSASLTVFLGAVNKTWYIEERTITTDLTFQIRILGSAGTGNFVMPPPGTSTIYFDGTNVGFLGLSPPIGGYWDHAGPSVPAWVTGCSIPPFLLCDGSTFSAATYPQLNQLLGGTTLPDARGRSRIALNGGTGRVTAAGRGVNGDSLLASGGAQNITLQTANLPAYTPAGSVSAPTITLSAPAGNVLNATGVGGSANVTGGGGAYNLAAITGSSSAPGFTGSAQGGSSTPAASMPPTLVGGITMIRAY